MRPPAERGREACETECGPERAGLSVVPVADLAQVRLTDEAAAVLHNLSCGSVIFVLQPSPLEPSFGSRYYFILL